MENTQNSESVRRSEKVIILVGGSPRPPRPATITQVDLAEERLLTSHAGRALRALDDKRGAIRELLRAGAEVEAGPLTVELAKRHRGASSGCDYTVLVVR